MFRTALLTALTVVGIALPIGVANAAPPAVYYPAVQPAFYQAGPLIRGWTVRYRAGGGLWHFYRTFDNPYVANCAARDLQCRGFEVVVGTHG